MENLYATKIREDDSGYRLQHAEVFALISLILNAWDKLNIDVEIIMEYGHVSTNEHIAYYTIYNQMYPSVICTYYSTPFVGQAGPSLFHVDQVLIHNKAQCGL